MFTGLVEEIGILKKIKIGTKSSVFTIQGNVVLEGTKIGDSIAVNGMCMTAVRITGNTFEADIMAESLRKTNLGELKPGSLLNLERAMAAGGRFGGHMMSGHIDGTGKILSLKPEDNAVWVKIEAGISLLRYIVEQGSIAIDGISLTVAKTTTKDFSVSIIPHTMKETILLKKKPGDLVNLECDMVGKYIEKLLNPCYSKRGEKASAASVSVESGINEEFLIQQGFI